MLTQPARTSRLTTALVAIGLLCCLYLTSLKLLDLPCTLGGCEAVIHSSYGTLWGLPLPLYAVPLWLLLTLPTGPRWHQGLQYAAATCLALGGMVLMAIQFFLIRRICPYCTLHAAAAFAVVFSLRRGLASRELPAFVLACTLPLLVAVKYAGVPADVPRQQAPTPQASATIAFRWLGPVDLTSPTLVVSFQCAHCLDLLTQVVHHPEFGTLRGPKVLLYVPPDAATDSAATLAALLSVSGTPQDQFTALFSQIDLLRDPLLTHNSAELRTRLQTLFPRYPAKLAEAQALLAGQVDALAATNAQGTPYLLHTDGKGTYGLKVSDLLFR